jgi:alanine dehydrogenase
MIIGIPTEIKASEGRVGMTPEGVLTLIEQNHTVILQSGAGEKSGLADCRYEEAGARIVPSAQEVFSVADLIIKVKEPQPSEVDLFREGQILFTYLHLAANRQLTERLMASGVVAIGYENVELDNGRLPLLEPMSEVAGKMAAMMGAHYLANHYGGNGKLIGGTVGVAPAKVVVLGAGNVGLNAALIAAGMGANVELHNHNTARLKQLSNTLPKNITTHYATSSSLKQTIKDTDIFIGTIYKKGDKTPHFISREMVASMKKGSIIVDVSIDQGGCVETSRPTTHQEPIFIEEGVLHYCVANMPGAYPLTSTYALTNETLTYIEQLANLGWEEALVHNNALQKGLNICQSKIKLKEVAKIFGYEKEKI